MNELVDGAYARGIDIFVCNLRAATHKPCKRVNQSTYTYGVWKADRQTYGIAATHRRIGLSVAVVVLRAG